MLYSDQRISLNIVCHNVRQLSGIFSDLPFFIRHINIRMFKIESHKRGFDTYNGEGNSSGICIVLLLKLYIKFGLTLLNDQNKRQFVNRCAVY